MTDQKSANEEEFQRIFKIYSERIYEKGWIKSCVERAMKLPMSGSINAQYYPVRAFFDEAIKSFIQGLHKGTIALCRATLEAALEDKSGIQNVGLPSLIQRCQGNVLPAHLVQDAKDIESWGNPYVHADSKAWKNVNNGLKTTFVDTAFEPTLGDEHIALDCLLKLRKIIFEIYKV